MTTLSQTRTGVNIADPFLIFHLYSSERAVSSLQPVPLFVKGGHLQRPHEAALGCTFFPSALPMASSAHTAKTTGEEKRNKLSGKCGERHTEARETAIPGVASLLYPVPWLVGAPAVVTGTVISFQTVSLVKVESWGTLAAANTLLPALSHGWGWPQCVRWGAGGGAGGHAVRKHLTPGTHTSCGDG